MGRAAASKLYRTFTKGLITEAGYLTYPENSSTDELNTVIKPKGSRSRRFGIDYEPSSTSSTITGMTNTSVISSFPWIAVDNDSDTNFLVVQIESTLHFYDMGSTPISSGKKSFTIDLTTYKVSTASANDVAGTAVQMTSGKGWLFVAQEFIDPILVEYDSAGDSISVLKIIVLIRDFDGIDDGLGNEEQPTTLSKEHLYNLKNQGWHQPYTAITAGGGGALETGTVQYTNPRTGGINNFSVIP